MANKKIVLDSGRECVTSIMMKDGEISSVSNVSKARTSWIRKGLKGGKFKEYKTINGVPSDSVLKELTEDEKNQLSSMIQEYQKVGE